MLMLSAVNICRRDLFITNFYSPETLAPGLYINVPLLPKNQGTSVFLNIGRRFDTEFYIYYVGAKQVVTKKIQPYIFFMR